MSTSPPHSPTSTSTDSDEFVFEGQEALNSIIQKNEGFDEFDVEDEFAEGMNETVARNVQEVDADDFAEDEDQNDSQHAEEEIDQKESPMKDTAPQQADSTTTLPQQEEHPTTDTKSESDPLLQARLQWDQVNQLRAQQGYGQEPSAQQRNAAPEEAPIRSTDGYVLLQQNDPKFKSHVKNIDEETDDSPNLMQWISRFTFGACGAAPIRSKSLMQEKKELLATCKIQLDLADETHIRIMGTIYKRLTGDRYNCPMVGSHWETLGFQRPNPQTDLRDAGMFGMIQLLSFLENGKQIPQKLLHLSQTQEHDFPFCVVSLNMTGITKLLLRTGKLNGLINKKRDVLDAMNLAYMSIFYDFYLTWKTGKTIHQYGGIKKSLEAKALKNLDKLVSAFEKDVLDGPFAGAPKQEF